MRGLVVSGHAGVSLELPFAGGRATHIGVGYREAITPIDTRGVRDRTITTTLGVHF